MLPRKGIVLAVALCIVVVLHGCCAQEDDKDTCEAQSGKECKACLRYHQCYYCTSTEKCTFYPLHTIFPKASDCTLADVRWGTCWVNFLALIISVAVIVLVIIITVCCWCHFYCKGRRTRSVDRDQHRYALERQQREQRQADRRAERQARTDAIREKYGIAGGSKSSGGKQARKNYERLP